MGLIDAGVVGARPREAQSIGGVPRTLRPALALLAMTRSARARGYAVPARNDRIRRRRRSRGRDRQRGPRWVPAPRGSSASPARARAVDDAVLVVDRLEARAAHLYSQRWPLHAELELVDPGDDRIVSRGPGAGLVFVVAATQPARLTTVRGNEEPFGGWWSERLESMAPSWLVAVEAHAVGVLEMASLIVPFEPQAAPEVDQPRSRRLRGRA